MEIVWTESALAKVEAIGHFIALDSPEKASKFIDKLLHSVERLAEFPYSGPLLPQHPAFRQLVWENYKIVYRVTENKIEIVTVLGPGQGLTGKDPIANFSHQ